MQLTFIRKSYRLNGRHLFAAWPLRRGIYLPSFRYSRCATGSRSHVTGGPTTPNGSDYCCYAGPGSWLARPPCSSRRGPLASTRVNEGSIGVSDQVSGRDVDFPDRIASRLAEAMQVRRQAFLHRALSKDVCGRTGKICLRLQNVAKPMQT